MAMAQANPKSGYIITNSGDTIRGIIDFRTNERLSTQCDFWANGETEGKNYKPGEIEGFRFDDNGARTTNLVKSRVSDSTTTESTSLLAVST